MATCQVCESQMVDGCSCNKKFVSDDGKQTFEPIPYGQEAWGMEITYKLREFCGDCGCAMGKQHHQFCDMEQCPVCQEQKLMCGCDIYEQAA